jgi:hypothetical protein
MNIDDLLDPLRYQNLRDYTAANLEAIGGGVFTERDTLEHLKMLDLIAKAYQSVHIPTLGKPIPQSTVLTNVTLTSSTDSVTVVTAAANEVIEILGIGVKSASDYETAGIQLNISKGGDTQPIMNFAAFDASSQVQGCMIYGKVIKVAQGFVAPSPLYINGGDSLVITSNSVPNNDIIMPVTYRKVSQ